jgi:hypothetical protein
MKSKQTLITAVVGIATVIALAITAAAGDQDANEYESTRWQAPRAAIPVGHHYGWGNQAIHALGLIWDGGGDDLYPALQCDEEDDNCLSIWSDDDDYDCEPAYDSYDYNSGYNDAHAALYINNGIYRPMSALMLLLQQFVQSRLDAS